MKFKYILLILFIISLFNSCNKNNISKKEEVKSAKLVFVGDIMTVGE